MRWKHAAWPLVFLCAYSLNATAQIPDCAPPSCSEKPLPPEEIARRALRDRFYDARDRRNHAEAESILAEWALLAGPESKRAQNAYRQELFEYRVFERGQCDVGKAMLDGERFGFDARSYADGVNLCQALALRANKPDEASKLFGEILDARVKWGSSSHVYDFYARQPTLNISALQWLRSVGLDAPSTDIGKDGALNAQIAAGRLENVERLLEYGLDPNLAVGNPARLPLQAAVDAEVSQRIALDMVRRLLRYGADPNKLRWQPRSPKSRQPTAEMAALFQQTGKARDPLRVEYRGLLFERARGAGSMYVRFVIGNGSDAPVTIPVWVDGDEYLLPGLPFESVIEYRWTGAERWQSTPLIEHGYSPRTAITLQPGDSQVVLYEWDEMQLAQWPAQMQFRLSYHDKGRKEHYSEAFALHDGRQPVDYQWRETPRDWLKLDK